MWKGRRGSAGGWGNDATHMVGLQTNYGAQVALQTLRRIEHDTAVIQSRVSTGLKVATARDSSAIGRSPRPRRAMATCMTPSSALWGLGHSILDVTANGLAQVRTHLHDMQPDGLGAPAGADVVALQREFSSHRPRSPISRSATINEQNWLRVDETIPPGGRRRQVVAASRRWTAKRTSPPSTSMHTRSRFRPATAPDARGSWAAPERWVRHRRRSTRWASWTRRSSSHSTSSTTRACSS